MKLKTITIFILLIFMALVGSCNQGNNQTADFTFQGLKWGDSRADVRRAQTIPEVFVGFEDALTFDSTTEGISILYFFVGGDKMAGICHSTMVDNHEQFNEITEGITATFGEPGTNSRGALVWETKDSLITASLVYRNGKPYKVRINLIQKSNAKEMVQLIQQNVEAIEKSMGRR